MKSDFIFSPALHKSGTTLNASCLYTKEKGYGFFTEEIRAKDPSFQLLELNTGFETWEWFTGKTITKLMDHTLGIYVDSKEAIPLSFKYDVHTPGNYKVTVTVTTGNCDGSDVYVFLGRRCLMKHESSLKQNSTFTYECITNLCDIIPRGYETGVVDTTVDVTILGNNIYLSSISIEAIDIPTIYIAGDSTVTDHPACYPYVPSNSYCGWGQMLGYYLNNTVAVSNHAHSGLTTESFKQEGHLAIVEQHMRKGDFLFLQFGHNDQKLAHLKASEGYRYNLIHYIELAKKIGATPVIISPICRNSWRGSDGTYNDLLQEYATVCKEVAAEFDIPFLDLHKKTYTFITQHGLEDSKRYFFPGDFTHTNDYGGYLFAKFLAEEMSLEDCLSSFVRGVTFVASSDFIPPDKIYKVQPPEGYSYNSSERSACIPVNYTDLGECSSKENTALIIDLIQKGLLVQRSPLLHPRSPITRVEALELIIRISNFFPTNVYNDMFEDVIGHEWYAGIVECAYSNGIIPDCFIQNFHFMPLNKVSYYEFLIFCINGYSSRKSLSHPISLAGEDAIDSVVDAAKELGIYDACLELFHLLSKEEALLIGGKLYVALSNFERIV